jgi:cell wall-associated NlpC family hydrolase
VTRRRNTIRTYVVAGAIIGAVAASPGLQSTLAGATATCRACPAVDLAGGAAVVADARQYLGAPYRWGGEDRSGMDCSGLVLRVYADLGVHLPRQSYEQARAGQPVMRGLAGARPGVHQAFGRPVHHVAIYVGGSRLIEAPKPGEVVHEVPVYETPVAVRRVALPGGTR